MCLLGIQNMPSKAPTVTSGNVWQAYVPLLFPVTMIQVLIYNYAYAGLVTKSAEKPTLA